MYAGIIAGLVSTGECSNLRLWCVTLYIYSHSESYRCNKNKISSV